jgi:hypothetical protein
VEIEGEGPVADVAVAPGAMEADVDLIGREASLETEGGEGCLAQVRWPGATGNGTRG